MAQINWLDTQQPGEFLTLEDLLRQYVGQSGFAQSANPANQADWTLNSPDVYSSGVTGLQMNPIYQQVDAGENGWANGALTGFQSYAGTDPSNGNALWINYDPTGAVTGTQSSVKESGSAWDRLKQPLSVVAMPLVAAYGPAMFGGEAAGAGSAASSFDAALATGGSDWASGLTSAMNPGLLSGTAGYSALAPEMISSLGPGFEGSQYIPQAASDAASSSAPDLVGSDWATGQWTAADGNPGGLLPSSGGVTLANTAAGTAPWSGGANAMGFGDYVSGLTGGAVSAGTASGLAKLAGAVGGALASKNASGGTQNTTREPWAPAQDWLKNNITLGQQLQDKYMNNPMSPDMQRYYGNLTGAIDNYQNNVAPQLTSWATNAMNNPYAAPKMPSNLMNRPQSPYQDFLGGLLGSRALKF